VAAGTGVRDVTALGLASATQAPGFTPLERVREVEAGIDVAAAGDRVTAAATLYDRRVTDVVLSGVPGSPGLSNAAVLSGRGVELLARAAVVRAEALVVDATLGVWGHRARVAALAGPARGVTGGTTQQIAAGLPPGSYVGRRLDWLGDLDGDGLVDAAEVALAPQPTFLGTPVPTQGATLELAARVGKGGRTRLHGLLEYRGGHTLLNGTEASRCSNLRCAAAQDRTRPVSEQAAALAPSIAGTIAPFVEPADFVRLRELGVAVELPVAWTGGLGVRLTVAGRNLVTWTAYSGRDPEVNGAGQRGLAVLDVFTQAPVRVWQFRFDLAY
jgi:hypothetical protein